jgi:hypothetical protein
MTKTYLTYILKMLIVTFVYVSFMYIVNVVICTLSMLVSKSFKKDFMFLAMVNINVDTAFQGNSGQEKCGVRGYGVRGVRGNLKQVSRATISVDVSNLLHFDVNHLFAAILSSVNIL